MPSLITTHFLEGSGGRSGLGDLYTTYASIPLVDFFLLLLFSTMSSSEDYRRWNYHS